MTETVIELKDVSLTLGAGASRVHVLKNIDLVVRRGEAAGIVGPSGSGKSTLLMVMAGLEGVDSGTVTIAGNRLNGLSEDKVAAFRGKTVGIVFQSFHLIPNMTALENVAVPLELAGRRDAFGQPSPNWRRSASKIASRIIPENSPAASSSASQSPGRWRQARDSSSPTNRQEIWIRRPGSRSRTSFSPRRLNGA